MSKLTIKLNNMFFSTDLEDEIGEVRFLELCKMAMRGTPRTRPLGFSSRPHARSDIKTIHKSEMRSPLNGADEPNYAAEDDSSDAVKTDDSASTKSVDAASASCDEPVKAEETSEDDASADEEADSPDDKTQIEGDGPPQEQKLPEKTSKPGTEDNKGRMYKGFLHIKCENCGKIITYNAKTPTDHFHCHDCGYDTPLQNMGRMKMECECGMVWRYHTNVETAFVELNCPACHSPMNAEMDRHGDYWPIRN